LDREREERNYFQLERDKVNTFWEITKRQLEEKKAELRNKDREMEDSEERHQVEIKVMKQKVKHLLYEHQNNLAQLKSEAQLELKVNNELNEDAQLGLRTEKRHLKVSMKEQELSHEDVIRNLKKSHDSFVTGLRDQFQSQAREIEEKYEKKLRQLRDELEIRRKTDIHEIEERKNAQINTLMRNHEKAFSDIKNYYNDITLNNLSLINTLKVLNFKKIKIELVQSLKKKSNSIGRNRRH
jgi:polyhydroxyalkanoate synthesis regulator phasin